MKFLPTTKAELTQLGWDRLDIILVTGDAYIDSPYMGAAMIGRVLADAGFRVGIIGQPDYQSSQDITRLGEPRLFWGVSGGAVDSMVANYTASGRRRRSDDYTPGGINNKRPDRAVIVYSNLIRQHFKQTVPIVLGGIEASLRRVAHYDFWSDRIRKSILFDAKADYLVYGMGETAALRLAHQLKNNNDPTTVRGLCYVGQSVPEGYLELPDYEKAAADKQAFTRMFHQFYRNNDPITARGLAQKQDTRYLIQNPPSESLSQTELDAFYRLVFARDAHPCHARQGEVRALETIRFSIASHRGCYGECNFCAIAAHEGRTVQWRSEKSILEEADRLISRPDFKGYIHDVGGPTANMYGFECDKKLSRGACPKKRCLFPGVCKDLRPDHGRQVSLLRQLRQKKGVKKVFVASGLRYDMLPFDKKSGQKYFRDLVEHHVSGQLKVAPEHSDPKVLSLMGKPPVETLTEFKNEFERLSRSVDKKQFLTFYFIAAHPGCTLESMNRLGKFVSGSLRMSPQQVQVFTPLPSTYSALMYYTGHNPFDGTKLFVERNSSARDKQKRVLIGEPINHRRVLEREIGRKRE